jgi:hypothetical protein
MYSFFVADLGLRVQGDIVTVFRPDDPGLDRSAYNLSRVFFNQVN